LKWLQAAGWRGVDVALKLKNTNFLNYFLLFKNFAT
jgi:hypothetical protein